MFKVCTFDVSLDFSFRGPRNFSPTGPSLQDGSGRVDLQEILDWLLYASWFLQKLLAMILCFQWESRGTHTPMPPLPRK